MSERRIAPSAEYDGPGGLVDRLVAPNGPFLSKQAVMTFAAALGYRLDRRSSGFKRGQGIRWAVFENSGDGPFVSALGLAASSKLESLSEAAAEELSRENIFEEYAAG